MRQFCFSIGVIFIVLALAAGLAQILSLIVEDGYQSISLGQIWYSISANSLVGFQALVEKNTTPLLWMPISYILLLPAWLAFGVPGALLYLACRGRRGGFD